MHALECAESLRDFRLMGHRTLLVRQRIMHEWDISPKQLKIAGLQTVLDTPDEVRGIRFGWRRRI